MKNLIITFIILFFMSSVSAAALVIHEGEKTYIEDQTGERWDVTQAKSIGFKPEGFQYGIGKTAFTPLDDSYLSDGSFSKFFIKPHIAPTKGEYLAKLSERLNELESASPTAKRSKSSAETISSSQYPRRLTDEFARSEHSSAENEELYKAVPK